MGPWVFCGDTGQLAAMGMGRGALPPGAAHHNLLQPALPQIRLLPQWCTFEVGLACSGVGGGDSGGGQVCRRKDQDAEHDGTPPRTQSLPSPDVPHSSPCFLPRSSSSSSSSSSPLPSPLPSLLPPSRTLYWQLRCLLHLSSCSAGEHLDRSSVDVRTGAFIGCG